MLNMWERLLELTISELKQWAGDQFAEDEYRKIAENVSGKYGNPRFMPENGTINRGYDKWKIRVLDMEFFSVNEDVYEQRVNRRGNKVFGLTNYNAK